MNKNQYYGNEHFAISILGEVCRKFSAGLSNTFGALQTNCVKSQFQIVKIVALMCPELPVIYRVNLTYFTFGMGLKIKLGNVKEIVFKINN